MDSNQKSQSEHPEKSVNRYGAENQNSKQKKNKRHKSFHAKQSKIQRTKRLCHF